MNLPDDVLLTIFLNCDIETLLKVSRVMTSDIFFLSFGQTCWKTTHRAIKEYTKRTKIDQHYISGSNSTTCMTLTAAKILLLLGFNLNEGNNRALELACKQDDVLLVMYLTQREAVLKTEAIQTVNILTKSVTARSYDVAAHLLTLTSY